MLRKHYKMAQAMIDFQKFSQFQNQGTVEQEKDMQTLLKSFLEEITSQQDPDFFQDNKDVRKKLKVKNQQRNQIIAAQKLKRETY